MRIPVFMFFCAAATLHLSASAQRAPAVMQLQVQADPLRAPLHCNSLPAPARPQAAPDPDRFELPSEALLQAQPLASEAALASATTNTSVAPAALAGQGAQRIAIWGDSHLAANFFTEELERLLPMATAAPRQRLIPANMGRAGVRLALRQSCVSPEWQYEPGYLGGELASAPGPGLVNMFSAQPGARLAWDLRKDRLDGGYERVRILYQQTEAPMHLALSIDGAPEQPLTLQQAPGPAILELHSEAPFAQLSLRLIDARFRLHGLELLPKHASTQVLDVFGYPGATVASWRSANLDYLRSWFGAHDYQLVLLEFGTNEGNVKPFDEANYRKLLSESVRNMKTVFPSAACVLIGPGDRGLLVRRSVNLAKRPAAARARHAPRAAPQIDLFPYARIHARIGQIQAEVAAENACLAWRMQDAMGGRGSAYAWAQQKPALMAQDLIHFTAAGYRRLAQSFVRDMGWLTSAPAAAAAAPAAAAAAP